MENKASDKRKDNWCVYMHENRFNGKKYIGITSNKPTRRWQNGYGYKKQTYFWRAIEKYGWDSFRHEVLYTDLTQDEAEALEIKLISKYKTQNSKKGYNAALGGAVNIGWFHTEEAKQEMSLKRKGRCGRKLSFETRQKISKAHMGKIVSKETRERLRISHLGHRLSEDTKLKLSKAFKGRPGVPLSDETKNKISLAQKARIGRQVICIETKEIFDSATEAAKTYGASKTNISAICKGRRNSRAGGYSWMYADQAVVGE